MNFVKKSTLLLVAAMCAALAANAQVPPNTIFQLDGNAANSNLTCAYGPCDYWNLLNGTGGVNGGPGNNSSVGHSLVRTFINGLASTNSFTGGGSKDPSLLSQWRWSGSPTPNKDTLNAGYAAAYVQNGDFILTFGADRASPSGDANIGIWFFQQSVSLNANGSFNGAHADHDIFVISAFTGGGGTSTISVYEWDHTCTAGVKNPTAGQCSDTNLRLLANPATGVCTTGAYCAVTNSATTTTTWEGNLGSPLFFEGGVDLTAAFASVGVTNLPCFSSFLEETRSSQSTSAVLKDFVLGGFPVCGISISKTCGTAAVDASGSFFNYPVSGTVMNTGVGTLYNVSVSDVVTHSDTTTQTLTLAVTPSTLGPGQVGTWSAMVQDPGLSVSDTATASASTAVSGGTPVTTGTPAQATCSTSLSTNLSITKSCTTSLVATGGDVRVAVTYSGHVCNNGDSAITNITLMDYASTSSTGSPVTGPTSLAPATGMCSTTGGVTTCTVPTCAPYTTTTYNPSSIDTTVNGGTGPGRYFFNDLIAITGAKSALGSLVSLTGQTETRCNNTFGCAPASCPICQGSGECTP